MTAEREEVHRHDPHRQHRWRQESPTALCRNRNRRQRHHHQVDGQEPQVHGHRPTRILQR